MDARPWRVTGHPLSRVSREQTLCAVRRAGEVLAWEDPLGTPDIADHAAARTVLTRAWRETADALTSCAPADARRLAELVGLLRQVKEAEDEVRDEQLAHQARTAQLVREALAALHGVGSVDELVAIAPAAATAIGFDRVVLSRIEGSTWVPATAHVVRDEKWGEEIVRSGRDDPRVLDSSLLETQIVRRRRPLVVGDVTGRPNLHDAMITASRTRSYAAAPIVGWGEVIGFLHADCYHQGRHLDARDRDLLWMFCDGLGYLVSRTVALDAVDAARGELDRLTSGVRSATEVWGWGTPESDRPEPGTLGGQRTVSRGLEGSLTRREVDVLRLMANGCTNGQIARRLVISEGTVKSHVKHILRKLDSANRAEAVSRWLHETHLGGEKGLRLAPNLV